MGLLGVSLWLLAAGCAVRSAADQLYPRLAPYSGREVREVSFRNTGVYNPDTLARVVHTQASSCALLGLPVCIPFTHIGLKRRTLDLAAVATDVQRLRLFYRIGGFFGTDVDPIVEPVPGDTDDVRVAFDITPGDSVLLTNLTLTGLDTVLAEPQALRALPSKAGRRFNLAQFASSADSLSGMLRTRGHAFARVLRNYSVDTVAERATAELQVIPGPLVRIDTILVRGARHLGTAGVVRQLTVHPGDVLLASRLVESQRNLYSLDIVQIATVSIAPDSLQRTPGDSSTSTVLAQVLEAPKHQVEVGVGWGRIECFRTDGSWIDRSFGGGARRLVVNAAASKLGVGQGLGGSACNAFREDTLANRIDYRLSTEFTQPYLLSPRNHLTLTAYAERVSEPTVFQRTDRGGSFSVGRLLGLREILTLAVTAEQGQTLASPVVFCTALLGVCTSTAIQEATRYRWLNRLTASYTRDRTDNSVDPTRGYNLRATADWAAPWLFSTSSFTRWTGEWNRYQRLSSAVVLATSLRAGTFFQTGRLSPQRNFLPPEQRFYAGGANTVRGFDRNQLGPGVWFTDTISVGVHDTVPGPARFVPTGGTALGLVNMELRTPSPVLSQRLSMAWFVDAGAVGTRQLWTLGSWRATPGFGFRADTPVGPFRLDVAYNAYPANRGPLYYVAGPNLIRLKDSYAPTSTDFWGRLHFTLAIGQAF